MMSKRRHVGEWVIVAPNTGFLITNRPTRAEIMKSDGYDHPDGYDVWCHFGCGDPKCREWATLWTEPDENGKRAMLCHVNECRMSDDA